MKLYKILLPNILTLFILFTLVGCTSDDDNGQSAKGPTAATLVFPKDNTECNTGVINANDITKSTVAFQWNAAQNTNSYTVTVTNLNTNVSSTTNSEATKVAISINRGTPYSWFVTSRATQMTETAKSTVSRFYNAGSGIENHAPFPAVAVAPNRGANIATTASVTLEWSGSSDIDNDITGYDVFFGTNAEPSTLIGSVTATKIQNVSVTASTTYYWKVVTKDRAGNSSTSEIFQFRVK